MGEDWHSPNFLRIPFMPQPGTGLAAWYSQAQYADLQLDLSTATLPSGQYRRICTLTLTRAVGIRLTNTTISYFMRE